MRFPITEIAEPELRAFVDYWESRKAGAFAPSWANFELIALPPLSIPRVVVVDVVRDPIDFVIRFWGTGHTDRKGVDKTGLSVNDYPSFRGKAAMDEYIWVITEKLPLASRAAVKLDKFGDLLPYEQTQVRVPLSDDGVAVTHVATLAHWDEV